MMISELENHEIIDLCDAGGGMTDAEAERMRDIVFLSEWSDHDTRDIPDAEWLRMLTEAANSGELSEEETQLIAQAATEVAGAIFEDTAGEHIEDRLQTARKWINKGTDADLDGQDRIALDLLHDAATGITSDLTDAETNDVIRNATISEACESATAINGIILVDGRRAYVAQ
ncbi:MAG: hypothetical protein GY903_01055 [Fuerstiella sp.]|nr:hypothetical protein [Fuerstiella sp.]MCP4853066.1 hypothetical protein [Fuerstiella sp.]